MMKYKRYLLIIIFIFMLIPKYVLGAGLTLTGSESGTVSLSGNFYGSISGEGCSAGGQDYANGKCSAGVIHPGSTYCCDAKYNGYTDCKKPAEKCYTGCHDADAKTAKLCEKDGGYWGSTLFPYTTLFRSDVPEEQGTQYELYPKLTDVTVSVTGKGTCSSYTVTCSGTQGGSGSVSVQEYPKWVAHPATGEKRCHKTLQTMRNTGVESLNPIYNGDNIAYGGIYTDWNSNDGIICYDTYYTRGCSATPWVDNPVPASTVPMGCWRKLNPTATSDYNKYIYSWSYGPTNSNYPGWEWIKEGVDGMTQEKCRTTEPSVCTPTATNMTKKDNTAKYCSRDPINVNFNSSYGCTEDSASFYSITCGDTLKMTYLPEDFRKVLDGGVVDSRVVYLQPGQGFEFNINMNHTKSCNGTFDGDKFNDSYNKATKYITRASISVTANVKEAKQEYAWYLGLRDGVCPLNVANCTDNDKSGGIVGIAKEYKDKYDNLINRRKFVFDYDGTLSFTYKYKGQNKTFTGKFEKIDDEEVLSLKNGKVNYTKTMKLSNGISIHNFNYEWNQNTVLRPKNIYFDQHSGEETIKTETNKAVDGGRKFYTDIKTDLTGKGNYDLNIKVDVYNGSQLISSVKNEKCDLVVYSDDIKYRIINVTNPFVNSTRAIPKNWLNSIANYTKTIKEDTWSGKGLYTFELLRDDIVAIKNSNSNDNNSYLGTCYKESGLRDSAINGVCSIINSK